MQMVTVFERIPDSFIELYDVSFQNWAHNFQQVGEVAIFKLRRPVEPLVLSMNQGRIIGVRLCAEFDNSDPSRPRMVIRPQTDADEEAIKRHVVDMRQALH